MNESYEFRKMKEPFDNTAALLTQPESQQARHKKITGFASFLIEDISELGEHLGRMNEIPAVENLFEINKIVLSIVDFFRIPYRYLKARWNNEALPFKFTRLGKFVYSALTLGLAIALLAYPLGAPVLMLSLASILFLRKVISLAKLAYKSQRLGKTCKQTEAALSRELARMSDIQKKVIALESDFLFNKNKSEFEANFASLKPDFEASKEKIIALKNDKAILEEQKSSIKTLKMMDKIITLSLATAYVVGFSLSLVLPPVGALVVTVAIITGASYATARLAPTLLFLAERCAERLRFFRKREVMKRNDKDEDTEHQESIEMTDLKPHDSTTDLMHLMKATPRAPVTTPSPPEEKIPSKPSLSQETNQKKNNTKENEDDEGEGEGEGRHNKIS